MTMARHKTDVGVGYRAAAEVRRLFKTPKEARLRLQCDKKVLNYWENGGTPSTFFLIRLHYAGADVLWIMTGKKNGVEIDPVEEV